MTNGNEKRMKASRVYVFGSCLIVALLLGVSLGVMISADTPTGFPTVIEPGSNVSESYYILFSDGGTIYRKNGTTGTIDSSGSNPSIMVSQAINETPEMRSVTIIGDHNFTSKIVILKKVNLVFDGNLTVYNSDWLEFGDAAHWVKGAFVRFNEVDGINQAGKCLVMKQVSALSVYFTKIKRFDVGIYGDPVGIGAGENSFFGGWITACNYGIRWNPTGAAGLWAQGNRFFMSIYACDVAGFDAQGTTAADMQLFSGTIDCLLGIDPDYPAAGGGYDIYDIKGGHLFLLVYSARPPKVVVAGSTVLLSQYFEKIPLQVTNRTVALVIGLNGAYGAARSVANLSLVPRSINITFGGTFNAAGEAITVAIQGLCPLGTATSNIVYKSATATGYVELTLPELYWLAIDGQSLGQLDFWAKTNRTSTSVTVSAQVYA